MPTPTTISCLYVGKDNPALVASGYAKILQYSTHYLLDAGYDVRLHCRVGHDMNIMNWTEPESGRDYEIWSGGDGMYGESIIPAHLSNLSELSQKPSIALFLGDIMGLGPMLDMLRRREIIGAAWAAVDWEPPSPRHAIDRHTPWLKLWSMSHHGHRVLQGDGLRNLLDPVWLGVNPRIWRPRQASDYPQDFSYEAVRAKMGYRDDGLNLFCCFANQFQRKGEYEMFWALREFHKRHPEVPVKLFCLTQVRREWDLVALADHLGIRDLITWSDDYHHVMGHYTEEHVALMMGAADVVMSLGYEGFGLQTIEAQALGKCVIGFNGGATPELLPQGIMVQPKKEIMYASLMRKPLPDESGVVAALEEAWRELGNRKRWDMGRRWVLNNLTWDHSGRALVDRLRSVEQSIADEELVGPPGPGPEAERLAREQIVIEHGEGLK